MPILDRVNFELTNGQWLIKQIREITDLRYRVVALVQNKKGGPYTKDDQEGRRNEVARLHFEHGYSARKISDVMKINRNTISADIRYLYDNLKEEVKQNGEDLILQQLGRLEAQRSRIIEDITNEKHDKIRYERLLLEVDEKINNILVRIGSGNKPVQELDESLIRELVLFLVIKYAKDPALKKEIIIGELVNLRSCTIEQAKQMFSDMEKLGLECCKKFREIYFVYDLFEFAKMRRYVGPNDEFLNKIYALCILDNNLIIQNHLIEESYMEKFGSKEKWNDETFEKLDKEKQETSQKHTQTYGEIIIEIIDKLDGKMIDKKRFLEYMNYMKVYFGTDDKKTLFERIMEID